MSDSQAAPTQEMDFLLVGVNQETLDRDAEILRQAGHVAVRLAHSGVEARSLMKSASIHFVITEMNMPAMNGLELLRLIRRTVGLSDLPVLLTSDNRNKDMVLYAVDELADGYLAVPYSGEDLLKSVNAILQRRKNAALCQQMVRRARNLLLAKKYDQAAQLGREVLAQEQTNSDALFVLSEAYFHLRQNDRARQFLKQYLARNPGSGKGAHLLAKVCRLDGCQGDAFSLLVKAHKENSLNTDLAIDLGKLYLDMEMEDSARQIFDRIFSSKPTDLNLIKIGKAFLKRGRLAEATPYLDRTVDPLPETVYVFAQFAEALEKSGKLAEAAAQYEKCLKLVPDHSGYLFRLGELLHRQGEVERARTLCLDWLKRQPEEAAAKRLFALVFGEEK